MQTPRFFRHIALAVAASFPIFFASTPAGAQSQIQITIDGNPVSVNPPPVIRTGRVFVPLRGVFEQLGASVVYDAGAIDATSNDGRDIAMHLGSTQATVNGNAQTIDVAPFLIGDSTYVPLRFISQALGANVSWDGSQQLVAIVTNTQQGYATPQPAGIPSYAYDDSYMNEPPPPLPEYEQPPVPVADYIWQPGYWASSSNTGYFWVPGTWVPAPQTNLLWTPPYWSFGNGYFGFHPGYWSQVVGYYGGINYGNGYYGDGYNGGRWENDAFHYNTAVTNVTNVTIIKNVYVDRTNVSPTRARTSYTGGPHGVQSTQPPVQADGSTSTHIPMTTIQREHLEVAAQDRRNFASVNGGTPPVGAVAKPYTADEKPAGAETPAPEDKIEAQKLIVHPAPALVRPVSQPIATPRPRVVRPAPLYAAPKTPAPFTQTYRPKIVRPIAPAGTVMTAPPMVHPAIVHPPYARKTIAPVPHAVVAPKPKRTIEPK